MFWVVWFKLEFKFFTPSPKNCKVEFGYATNGIIVGLQCSDLMDSPANMYALSLWIIYYLNSIIYVSLSVWILKKWCCFHSWSSDIRSSSLRILYMNVWSLLHKLKSKNNCMKSEVYLNIYNVICFFYYIFKNVWPC